MALGQLFHYLATLELEDLGQGLNDLRGLACKNRTGKKFTGLGTNNSEKTVTGSNNTGSWYGSWAWGFRL